MSRFAKVPIDPARWMLRNVVHDSTPPDAVCILELTTALVAGDLPSWSQREWGRRWKCSTSRVRRIVDLVAEQYPNTTQTGPEQYANTLRECFPHLMARKRTASEQHPNTTQTTRARSSLRERDGEEEEENNRELSAPPVASEPAAAPTEKPSPTPKPKSKRDAEAEQGVAVLEALRAEHHQAATGTKPRGAWATGKVGKDKRAKVKRYLQEIREAEVGDPLAVLEAVGRWVYLAQRADWLRERSDPLASMLGGKPTTRHSRTLEALDWSEGKSPIRKPSAAPRSQQGGFQARLRAMRSDAQPERVVINPEAAPADDLFGGPFNHPTAESAK